MLSPTELEDIRRRARQAPDVIWARSQQERGVLVSRAGMSGAQSCITIEGPDVVDTELFLQTAREDVLALLDTVSSLREGRLLDTVAELRMELASLRQVLQPALPGVFEETSP